jgi:uncharacterized SAM-binding protein YcdF (DUF218 family)
MSEQVREAVNPMRASGPCVMPLPELVSQNESAQAVDCTPAPSATANRPARSAPRRKWLRNLLAGVVLLAGVAAVLYGFRARILTVVAEGWIVNDPLVHADAIVVLGGGFENRPAAAAKLFHEGLAPRIIYMDVQIAPSAKLGITLTEREITRRMLLSNGVPEEAMTVIGEAVTSTYDESRAVQAWVRQTGAKSVIIPTDMFHTRRVRWVFRKELAPAGASVSVRAVPPVEGYGTTNWWHRETGLIAFENEVFKSLYYWYEY